MNWLNRPSREVTTHNNKNSGDQNDGKKENRETSRNTLIGTNTSTDLPGVLLLLPTNPSVALATKGNANGLSENTLPPVLLLALLPGNCTV